MNAVDLREEDGSSISQIIGPIFVLCTFALSPTHWVFFCLGLLGLVLCAQWRMQGFAIALLLLLSVGAVHHYLSSSHHLWLMGIESSYCMAFFITAVNAARYHHFFSAVNAQLTAKGQSISNLEEEFSKSREILTAQQVAAQDRINILQKEIEDKESEVSSLSMLNEVIRKTSAKESEEKDRLRISATLIERLPEPPAPPPLPTRDPALEIELSMLRTEKERVQRLYETEKQLREKQGLALQNMPPDLTPKLRELSDLVSALRGENEELKRRPMLQPKEAPSQPMEHLYKQLKAQFDEKNKVLHEVRSELFHKDTRLATWQMEADRRALEQDFALSSREAAQLSDELHSLEKENRELEDLITNLLQPPMRKKKDD